MGELTAGRETDAMIAETMGWTRRPHPQGGAYWIDAEGRAQTANCHEYTTDLAMVVPMLDRLGELAGDGCEIRLIRYGDGGWDVRIDGASGEFDRAYTDGEFEGDIAPLACAKALLWVWERRDKAVDGSDVLQGKFAKGADGSEAGAKPG